MKLLYITNQICGAGGLERVLSIKASYLADTFDYEIHFVTLNQGDTPLFYDFSDRLIYHDVSIPSNPVRYITSYIKGIKKIVKEVSPDVISVCDDGLKGFFLPILLGKPCPMIYERHVSKNIQIKADHQSFIKKLKSRFTFRLMNFAGKKYDRFVVLTNDNLKEWKLKNTMVISNPLSFKTDKFSNLNEKKVLVVGRHSFQKGYDRLLQIWERITKKHPDWHLDIYGKFDKYETYLKLATKMGLNDTVNFYPPVKNIDEKYQEASIYLMTSRFEGFGMVLIEAMAFGVPCISFDCPCGPSDIITNDVDGFLIKNNELDDFAEKISELINDKNLRKEMGSNAIKKAQLYSPDVIVPKWDTLFKELIKSV